MENAHPELAELGDSARDSMNAALETLVATKVADAMGSDIASHRLARMLMQVVLEYAGARRGLLALTRPGGLALAARFDVRQHTPSGPVVVPPDDAPAEAIAEREAPLSILRYVFRTRKRLYLPDASTSIAHRFAGDPYFADSKPRSILCVPIVRPDAPLGVLYVENDLVPRAFTATRVALVEHVAAQAAVTFDNARLFRELKAAEERLMTLVEHAPIALWASDANGVLTFARGRALVPLVPDPNALVGRPIDDVFAQAWWLVEASRSALAGHATGGNGPVGGSWLEAQAVPLIDGTGRVSGHTGIAVDVTARARLTEDLRALATQLSTVEDAERRQLARDLHDSVAQSVIALKLELETLVAPGLEPRLRALVHRLGEVHQQVRTVMFELYPTMLDDLGLGPALAHYARALATEGLDVSVSEAGERGALAPDRGAFLFRAAKELLRNVVKHARARHALVTLSWRQGALRLATGVRALIDSTDRFEVVGEASDGREAVRLCGTLDPDVLVIDVAMPNLNGIEAVRQIRRDHPKLGIIVLSVHAEPEYILEALRAGATGYLLKVSAFEDLLAAIDAVVGGRRHLGRGISELALHELVGRDGVGVSPVDKLSPREREVLQLIGEGYTTDEIAGQLHISSHTVQTHRKHLLVKLGLNRTVDLARFALRHGLTSL